MLIMVKVFSAILGFLVISKTFAELKRKRESLVMTIFWTLTWAVIMFIAFFPSIIDWLIRQFDGQGTGLGTFFGLGLTFLFFIIYRVYIKADRVERLLATLIREIAIRDINHLKGRRK